MDTGFLELEGQLIEVKTAADERQTLNVRKFHGVAALYTCETGGGELKLMAFEPDGSTHEVLSK